MPSLGDVVELLHAWFPPETAESWDAVGLVYGDPASACRRVLLAIDPVLPVAEEAAAWGADLVVTHHPLFLKGVHGFAPTTPKGRTLWTLAQAGCGLLVAHTNADRALGGVSEALARALELQDLRPLQTAPGESGTGIGRIGTIAPTTLAGLLDRVAGVLPATVAGVRAAGDPAMPVRRVALCGGAGDSLLDLVRGTDADVFVTSDLRHHLSSEFVEGGKALIDVPHFAAEWTWLPVLRDRLAGTLAAGADDRVEVRVSTTVTDPWTLRI
jgi:dinuclear metal center YbgI/SA1388 family protein